MIDRFVSSEPAIAKRVRCLAMRHHHIRNLKSNLLSTPRVIPLRQRIKAALRLPGTISQSSLTISPAVEPISFEDMIKSLTCIFPGLVNLEEFLIDSWNWPAQFNFQPLFSAAWTSFGRNLRRLSLGGNLEGFRVLIDSKPSLDSLQELDLEFTNNLNRADPDHADDESILLDYVAPFINALSPQLQALRIWSWASADLSSMFKQLGAFPMLNAISIRAAFNRSFRHDPSGLTLLLHSCSPTLRDLQLRLNPSGFANPVSDSPLSRWLSATITSHEGIGTGLQSLQLYPSASDVGLNSLITCIGRSTYSMRKLVVRDRYLHHGDIVRLVAAFSSPSELQSLRLNVWALSAPLMDLLSESFPSLKELTLTVGDVNGGEELWATVRFTDIHIHCYY